MKAIRFSIIVALMSLLASCQEEILPSNIVKEGIPTSIDFSISVPAAEKIDVTRASVDASESEIRELMLIMFEDNGRKMVLDLTPYMDAGTVENGYRKYTLTSPVAQDMYGGDVLSGNYRVYAVANWSGSFSSLKDLDQLSEDELVEQIATNPNFVYNISGNERFPMSSITDNVAIELDGKSSLQIKLKRLVARIEFEFQNGSSQVDGKDENPNFIPSSYAIYNIPSKANLFSKDNNAMSGLADGDFGKSADISLSSRSFEFFMLENVQNVKTTGCDSQAKRETWSGGTMGAPTLPEDKNFTYAPDYGTFVVVKGSYTGTSYIGDVSYTIHLGNFSEKTNTANGKDFSNFKVNRNERQIYKVTVNGVRSIVTEVTANNETQPGAEGAFAETAENVFVLDAHYEKVMMDLTGLGESAYLFVDTPYCPDNNGHIQVKLAEKTKAELDEMGLDYKWVSFIKPAAADNFPDYVKANSGDIHDLVNDIIAGTGKYYAEIDGKKLTAAFVDEYFYETKPDGSAAKWTEFVNTDNRTMSIRPGISYSTDGNSSLVQNSHIELSQRSIKTTYAFDGKDPNDGVYVPFGIETWDETWADGGSFHTEGNNYSLENLTDDNGWNNTKILTAGAIPANVSKAGYLSSISDNSKESHVYTSYTGGLGYNACLLRNRDENNDGEISDSELKWYLPAIQQYTNIWLSEDMLHEDTQLFDRAQLTGVNDALNRSSVYYSSSQALKRLYWALEGASYGEYNSNWSNANNRVRCVRNLVANSSGAEGAVYDGVPSILATDNHSANVISVDNITAVRNIDHIGEYGISHSERSSDNLLPRAFEVAKVYLGETIGAGTGNLITIPAKTWLVLNTDQCTGSRSGWILGYEYTLTLAITPIEGDSYICNGIILDSGNNYKATFENGSSRILNVTVTKADGSRKVIPVTFEFSGSNYNDVDYDGEDPEQEIYDGEIKTGNGTGSKDRFDESSFNATDLCSQGYYQQPDRSDLGMWRVPNQRELMLMLQFGYVVAENREGCFSSTFLTGYSSSFKNQPFGTYNSGITLNTTQNSYMYVRCVMDAKVFGDNDNQDGGESGGSGGGTTPPVTPPDQGSDEGGDA